MMYTAFESQSLALILVQSPGSEDIARDWNEFAAKCKVSRKKLGTQNSFTTRQEWEMDTVPRILHIWRQKRAKKATFNRLIEIFEEFQWTECAGKMNL